MTVEEQNLKKTHKKPNTLNVLDEFNKKTHDQYEGELSHHYENLRITKESKSTKIIKSCNNFELLKR